MNTYEQSIRYKVFIAYSHRNEDVLDRIRVHLKPLEVMGLLDAWSDKRIEVGLDWRTAIRVALSRSRLAILLVSADFLASDFVIKHELPYLLAESKQGSIRILPIILSPCRFARDSELSHLQSVNSQNEPLLLLPYPRQEKILDDLAALIEECVKDLIDRQLASKAIQTDAAPSRR